MDSFCSGKILHKTLELSYNAVDQGYTKHTQYYTRYDAVGKAYQVHKKKKNS